MNFRFIFDKDSIYGTLFINVKTVTEHFNTKKFSKVEAEKYSIWSEMAMRRYDKCGDAEYHEHGCFLPEVSKIVCISYGNLAKDEDGDIKRNLTTISNKNEEEIIQEFFKVLNDIYSVSKSIILCGHNIIGYDIPFLIKRGIKHNLSIPPLLKISLSSKPWENNILDTINIWKFNGNEFISLKMISEFLQLKTNYPLLDASNVSKLYYEPKQGMLSNWLEKLSINELNLIIQLVRRLNSM